MARKDNKINMPSSGAGLTNYFDAYESNIMFSPQAVTLFILVSIIAILGLMWLVG